MATYRCHVCGRTFNTRWKLDKHLGKVHGRESEAKPKFEAKHPTPPLIIGEQERPLKKLLGRFFQIY